MKEGTIFELVEDFTPVNVCDYNINFQIRRLHPVHHYIFCRLGDVDYLYVMRRNRKIVTRHMLSRLLNDMGHMLEGDCCVIPHTVVRLSTKPRMRRKIDDIQIANYIGTDLHRASEYNGGYYHLNHVNRLKKTTTGRRSRKVLTEAYLRSFVRRLGGMISNQPSMID